MKHTCRDPHSCSSNEHRDDDLEYETEDEAYAFAMHKSHACEPGCLWCVGEQERALDTATEHA
jgi:aconitase B